MDLRVETVFETIGAKILSEQRRRTAPFMSKSLNLEETLRFKSVIELLDEKFDFGGLVLMSGRPDNDLK